MKDKNTTTKKSTNDNINSYKNLNNLHGSTDNNYDMGNNIINEENKKIYGNNSNLYSKEYVPNKTDVNNSPIENRGYSNTGRTTDSYSTEFSNSSKDYTSRTGDLDNTNKYGKKESSNTNISIDSSSDSFNKYVKGEK